MSKIKNGMKSLFTIAKNAATGVDQSVPESIKNTRLALCESCPSLVLPTKNCSECGCFVKAKTQFRQESCPLGKWSSWEPLETSSNSKAE